MKLLLSQQELEQAVTRYVTGMINLAEGTDIAIDFKAGRGENGITAEVDINYMSVTSIPAVTAGLTGPMTQNPVEVVAAVQAIEAVTAKAEKVVDQPDPKPAAEVAKPETRKATGKALFGNTDKINPKVEPANDADAGEPAAAAAGGAPRKTLFS